MRVLNGDQSYAAECSQVIDNNGVAIWIRLAHASALAERPGGGEGRPGGKLGGLGPHLAGPITVVLALVLLAGCSSKYAAESTPDHSSGLKTVLSDKDQAQIKDTFAGI